MSLSGPFCRTMKRMLACRKFIANCKVNPLLHRLIQLELLVYRKLRLGKYETEAVLDLHRKSVKQAREEVYDFITTCMAHSLRTVMILHGKGERSDPPALLKSYVNKWLPSLDNVMAYHSAQLRHGGSGALYVLLRKSDHQKMQNRIKHSKGRV